MIINNAPTHEAILGGVSELGEFRIKSTAKSFHILSSALYSNKIRAIIRELSCNAIDSHTAAGSSEPFDVHLPTLLEPWFAVRDYGIGLTQDDVVNIYTTYFESTKTTSNEYVGALGLGSKSPFSYTQSFTVTAIKHGQKNIYTAFINQDGIPSIALMDSSDAGEERTGVEVKFAVENASEFRKFESEAREVLRWFREGSFSVKGASCHVLPVEYAEKDIIHGVSRLANGYGKHSSIAVMGNVPYPIEIPNSAENLGDLAPMLSSSLVINFPIGSLDFQPSREGLSYTKQTIDSIRAVLTELRAALEPILKAKVDSLPNMWDKIDYLTSCSSSMLWEVVARKVLADTAPSLSGIVGGNRYAQGARNIAVSLVHLESNFNIAIKAHRYVRTYRSTDSFSMVKPFSAPVDALYGNDIAKKKQALLYENAISINIHPKTVYFVVNDTATGANERAKYHFRENDLAKYNDVIYVLTSADPKKPMKTKEFFDYILGPPEKNIYLASTLDKKPVNRSGQVQGTIPLMRLTYRSSKGECVWDADVPFPSDDKATFYYMPLTGFLADNKLASQTGDGKTVAHALRMLSAAGLLPDDVCGKLYGVRKSSLKAVMTKKNWINVDDLLEAEVRKNKQAWLGTYISLSENRLINTRLSQSLNTIAASVHDKNSPIVLFANIYREAYTSNPVAVREKIKRVMEVYAGVKGNVFDGMRERFIGLVDSVNTRYPLLAHLSASTPNDEVSQYINMIDEIHHHKK